jgi:hypothetical protein
MAAQVLSFFQRSPRFQPGPSDWTQQELAEFYRVESALIRAGIRVGTDRGLSDENEPWFVFYRSDDGEVVIHFARIDGEYIIAGPAYEEIARGFDFSALVRNMVARHPLIKRPERGDNVSIHPAALLVAIVGTAFFKSGEARAAETGASAPPASAHRPTLLSASAPVAITGGAASHAPGQAGGSAQIPVNQAVMILAAAMMAAEIRVDTRSLAPSARDAIAEAARALDFSGQSVDGLVPATPAPVAEPVMAAAPPTPVQTVSSVLALVALLSTLPSPGDVAAHADLTLAGAAPTGRTEAPSLFAASGAPWTIDVQFAAGGLAEVAAVHLVRAAVDGAAAQRVAVIEVEKLPEILLDLIERGSHLTVPAADARAPIDAPPPSDGVTLPPTTDGGATPPPVDPAPPEASVPPAVPPPVAETPVAPPPVVQPPVVEPPVTIDPTPVVTPKPALPAFDGFASQDLVKQFVDYFLAHTDQVSIMTRGLQVVIFDSRVTTAPETIDHLTSMTFTFFDGSEVNLVGAQSAFLNHDGLS